MRREGRVSGKPGNHSRVTGKCRVVGCTLCHEALPLNKSKGKGKGRSKRLLSDIPSTHLLSDWRVNNAASLLATRSSCGARKLVRPCLQWDHPDTDWAADDGADEGDDGAQEPEGWALSISLLLDTALENIQDRVGAKIESQNAGLGVESVELDAHHTGDSDGEHTHIDVPDFEAFKNEFEVFRSQIEAGSHKHTSVAESVDSWSGIELSEADDSSQAGWEDDWSIVDEIAA